MRDVSAFPYYYARIVSRQPLAPSWLRVVFVDKWGQILCEHVPLIALSGKVGQNEVNPKASPVLPPSVGQGAAPRVYVRGCRGIVSVGNGEIILSLSY